MKKVAIAHIEEEQLPQFLKFLEGLPDIQDGQPERINTGKHGIKQEHDNVLPVRIAANGTRQIAKQFAKKRNPYDSSRDSYLVAGSGNCRPYRFHEKERWLPSVLRRLPNNLASWQSATYTCVLGCTDVSTHSVFQRSSYQQMQASGI